MPAPGPTPPTHPPRTLLVIPVFNHGATLRAVAEKALDAGFPVLVVDDGSTDGALARIADLPVQTHRLPHNRGKGAAILAAAEIAARTGFEAILTVDADGQHDPADGPRLLEAARGSWPAIAVGERTLDGVNVPRSSQFGRRFSNFWVRLECGRSLPDTQSGFRLYPVAFLRGTRFLSRRYTFEIEVLVRAAWAGLPILSGGISVFYPPRDERVTHFRKFRDNARLSALHTFLVTRSLFRWGRPERRFSEHVASTWHFFRKPRLGARLAGYFRRLALDHASAGELAAAVWIGIFIGALPIIPFGIATILYVIHRFRLNPFAAVGASNVCCAPFVPFLCIEAGYLLRHGHWWTEYNRQTLLREIHHRLWEWLLGSFLVGPVIASAGALSVYLLVLRLRRTRPQHG